MDVDVIVIGGGPVGTIALALLGRAGLTAVGLEKDREVWATARAVHFDGETMRTLQGLGIAEKLKDATIPMKDVDVVNEADEVLVHAPTDRLGDQAWNEHISFHQPDVERLVREVVDATPGVELRCGATATRVENTPTGVAVTVIDRDGTQRVIRARWAIAADGARSEIRTALGIENDRFGEDAQWLVVDGHLVDAPGYATDMVQFARYSRPALWLRLPGTRVRMEFMLVPGDDPDELVTAAAVERISRGALPADRFTADRQALYTFRGRVARQWRSHNIFLAGDAAHQAPPLFGQGLCAGIRDVANLAWKMALVARGADAALLDTYESERKPHATFWVDTASQQAKIIQTLDANVAAGRDEFIRQHPEASAVPAAPALGPGLHDGARDPRAGMLGIQPVLADGTRLDDMVGARFLVAADPQLAADLPADIRAALDADAATVLLTDAAQAGPILSAAGARAVVMRPDRYILGVADTAADLADLLTRVPSITVAGDPLRISFFVPPAPLVAARERGLLLGSDIVETWTTGSPAQLKGLLDGDLDVVVTAIDNLFEWVRAGADVRLVGLVEPSTHLAIYAAPEVGNLSQLEGRTFAVDAFANGFALVARQLLQQAGVTVEWAEVGGVKERLQALRDGEAAATVLGPPFDDQASAAGFRTLAIVQEHFPSFPGQGLVVRSELLGTAKLDAFLSALRAGGLLPVDPAGLDVLTGIRADLGLLPADIDLRALVWSTPAATAALG